MKKPSAILVCISILFGIVSLSAGQADRRKILTEKG